MCEGITLSGFNQIIFVLTQGCRYAPTAGLKLANAFGVSNGCSKIFNAYPLCETKYSGY